MSSSVGPSEINSSEWLSINQFVQELKEVNSQCISVYYPYGKGKDTIELLHETSRSEILKKIEKKIELKILELKKNPVSIGSFTKTLCIFGWIKNQKIQIKVIGTSKKLPYVYMVNKKPYVKPFSDILNTSSLDKSVHLILEVALCQSLSI